MQENYKIRKMTMQDLADVVVIERESFSIPWSLDSYMSEIKNKWATYQVCTYRNQVIGYCGIWTVFDEAHITNIAVAPQHRHQGIGQALMLAMEKVAREKKSKRIMLEVRPSNEWALRLYRSLSYFEMSRRVGYYADNQEDALVLCKNLEFYPEAYHA